MKIRGAKLLVTRYERPEKIGSLFLNPAYLTDTSRSLWEVCVTTDEVTLKLGVVLEEGWILVTPPNSGVYFGRDAENREIFLLAASSIRRIIPWTTDVNDMILASRQILVAAPRREETRSGLVVVRSDEEGGSRTGRVVAKASNVCDVAVGDEVLFSVHAGVETQVGGEKFMIIDEAAVLAVV
jgi:co-chaperonin GroES (HSP10)